MAVKTVNLTIVFIDLKGYTARTAMQTREQHVEMLRRFRSLVHTAARAFSGTMLKGIGDAFLLTFRSPTDAVLFGVAAQDYFWKYNRERDSGKWLEVRVAINVGEVCLEGGDVFGEAVNIASRVESLGDAGDVLLTEAVFLSMNKAEVPTEEIGEFELKGVPQPVRIHRTLRVGDGRDELPYGGLSLGPVEALAQKDWTRGVGATLKSLPGRVRLSRGGLLRRIPAPDPGAVAAWLARLRPRSYKAPAAAGGVLLLAAVLMALWFLVFPDPFPEVRLLLEQDQPGQALTALENHPEQKTAGWYALRGDALTRQHKYDEAAEAFSEALSRGMDPDDEPWLVPDALQGLDRRNAAASKELFEKGIGREGIRPLLRATENIRYWLRWNAVHVLRALGEEDRIDYVNVYILDLLHAGSCSTRRRAAEELARVGDERALEPLTRAGQRSEDDNYCMGSSLDAAGEAIRKRLEAE